MSFCTKNDFRYFSIPIAPGFEVTILFCPNCAVQLLLAILWLNFAPELRKRRNTEIEIYMQNALSSAKIQNHFFSTFFEKTVKNQCLNLSQCKSKPICTKNDFRYFSISIAPGFEVTILFCPNCAVQLLLAILWLNFAPGLRKSRNTKIEIRFREGTCLFAPKMNFAIFPFL